MIFLENPFPLLSIWRTFEGKGLAIYVLKTKSLNM
jgi:hypothetical protein